VLALNGYGQEKNINKAIALYIKAAELDYNQAQYELSVIYSSEKLNVVDYEKHLFWLKKAANNNHVIAIHNLATIAIRVKKYTTAINLFSKAKELGYAPSILSLANMYYYGLGTAKDYKKAFALFNSAYEAGEVQAAFPLATLYERGLSVTKDINKAKALYKKAIDDGHETAGFNLAILLLENNEKSDGVAIMKKMAEKGDRRAIKYLKSQQTVTINNSKK
jgi:TPR repeat protein